MGYALAEELASHGAEVILVSGPVSVIAVHPGIQVKRVQTAEQMLRECLEIFGKTDGAILSAAVADFRPKSPVTHKIKRKEADINLVLEPNPDIAATLGRLKTDRQFLAGFALETEDGLKHAQEKLQRKNFNFIVLNSLSDKGSGFNSDTNKITIIDRNNNPLEFELKSKQDVAADIVEFLANQIL
jgi:phosphopantothenoylcysteine decarboxylase/phosphopantothenate--cysteine ligase